MLSLTESSSDTSGWWIKPASEPRLGTRQINPLIPVAAAVRSDLFHPPELQTHQQPFWGGDFCVVDLLWFHWFGRFVVLLWVRRLYLKRFLFLCFDDSRFIDWFMAFYFDTFAFSSIVIAPWCHETSTSRWHREVVSMYSQECKYDTTDQNWAENLDGESSRGATWICTGINEPPARFRTEYQTVSVVG